MYQTNRFIPDPDIAAWRAPDDARQELYTRMDAFMRAAAGGDISFSEQGSPALTFEVSAGVGKTRTALRLLAEHGRELLSRGHVLFYVPTLELAERAAADLQNLDGGLPIDVIRGRGATAPLTGKPMCERSDLVARLAGLVPSITQALCRVRKAGEIVEAPCASGCPYLAQNDANGAKIHFLSHNYLDASPPIDRDTPVALRIIDEKVWPTLVSAADIYLEEFMRAPPRAFPVGLRADLALAKSGIVAALQNGWSVRTHLLSLGCDKDKLASLSKGEAASRDRLEIMPRDSSEKIDFLINSYDRAAFYASRKRQALFDCLASDKTLGPNRLILDDQHGGSHGRQIIRLCRLNQLPRDAPLLLIDADADPEIADRLAPWTEFATIATKPQAEVVQISDLTLSNAWLLDQTCGTDRRAKILTIIEREVNRADGNGVLVVSTKPVLAKMHEDIGQGVDSTLDDARLKRPLLGATPRWFGPKMLGVNDFEKYRTIIIVGRLQPGIPDIETQARCLFSDCEDPVTAHADGPLPEQRATRIMQDGSVQSAKVRAHPNVMADAVLRQTRECATLQAIARLRLVSPDTQKRVVVMCNMPLPDLPIDKLITLEALYRDLEDEPDLAGYLRMEQALRATMGQTVRGTRVSAAGLAADLPLDFPSVSSAKEFRRGRTTQDILSLIDRIGTRNRWPTTQLDLTVEGRGGRGTPAVVLAEPKDALSQAKRLWPKYTPRLVSPKKPSS